jgi:hypothetical protein
MRALIPLLRYYRYPYYHWAKALGKALRESDFDENATIIDAPCGDGAVSYWLMKQGIGRRYELHDLSPREARLASYLRQRPQANQAEVTVTCGDIAQIEVSGRANDTWLLINSLFLLPDIDNLVERMRPRIQTVVGLFPEITHKNYLAFTQLDPHSNIHAMDRTQTIAFFHRHGYALRTQSGANYIAHQCLRPRAIRKYYWLFLNPFEYVVPKRNACYWIGVFSRQPAA